MKTETIRFQRLKWKSPWLQLGIPFSAMGLWFLIHQLWNGFLLLSTIGGILMLSIGIPICAACFQTVVIDGREVRLKLGFLTLRRIPAESVRTLIGTTVSLGRGGSCREDLIVISCQSPEQLNSYNPISKQFLFGFLPPRIGLWMCYSGQRIEQLRQLFLNVEYLTI